MGALLSLKFDLNETVQYRYLIVSKQIVFYEVIENTIEIIQVLDARRYLADSRSEESQGHAHPVSL